MAESSKDPSREWVLRVRDLRLGYGRRVILDRVNIDLLQGDLAFLLGDNGSGKTTLMHALLGDLSIKSGSIERNPKYAIPEHVGFVPQRGSLEKNMPMTVAEFMDLGMLGLKLDRNGRRERSAEGLEQVGMDDVSDMSFWSLSGGMRQRVMLARALARRPRLLYLDEPTISMDVNSTASFWSLLSRLHEERDLTILCISHDPWAASNLASLHLTLADGSLTSGPARDLMARMEG
ncbi:MAG: metal ABC transporter ATP-binding protein [Planctomycetota bacterium]